jgi:hypothetical protein
MDNATAELVFAAAAERATWKRTNLGLTGEVTHDSYTWTVVIPTDTEPAKARITGRSGFGGGEVLDVEATWAQTVGIADAAMGALRA